MSHPAMTCSDWQHRSLHAPQVGWLTHKLEGFVNALDNCCKGAISALFEANHQGIFIKPSETISASMKHSLNCWSQSRPCRSQCRPAEKCHGWVRPGGTVALGARSQVCSIISGVHACFRCVAYADHHCQRGRASCREVHPCTVSENLIALRPLSWPRLNDTKLSRG
jgi:hypothetical protein